MSAEDQSAATGTEDPEDDDQALYSGRWTDEEEKYAQCLIKEFRAGNIEDLENGATLRNYIAKMLLCPPKRITKKYERTAYNGKLTYCRSLVAIPEEEARQRREQLKELREKFLVSRKHRLLGKPYQKPGQKKASTPLKPSAAPQQAAGSSVAVAVGPGLQGGGLNSDVQSQAATALLNSMNPSLSVLAPTSLPQPPAPSASIPPFASLTGGTFLSQSTNPLIASSLRQQLLLSTLNLGLRGSLVNPSLLDNRSLLLNRGLFGGFQTSQEITRQTLLAQIRSEDERIAILQRLAALQNIGIATRAQQAVGNQEEKSDFANQQIIENSTASPSDATQTEAVSQGREGQSRGGAPRGPKKRAREQP